jgi:hypothetical protein
VRRGFSGDLAGQMPVAAQPGCRSFFGPRPATLWLRRTLHDTTVHYADAALATGTAFEVAPDLAADAISEWLALLFEPITPTIKPPIAELRGTGQTLRLRPDVGAAWLITRTPTATHHGPRGRDPWPARSRTCCWC